MSLPKTLPIFDLSDVSPDKGKQDKIEVTIGSWDIAIAHDDELPFILARLGSPPPLYVNGVRSRTRENHGDSYGWIFRTTDTQRESRRYTSEVRREALAIEGLAEKLQVPLFSGKCEWKVKDGTGNTSKFLNGKLVLSVNPTRFVRHRGNASTPLPQGLQQRADLGTPAYDEVACTDVDNWLPLGTRTQATATPERWQGHLERYFQSIEVAFQSELARVCNAHQNHLSRSESVYNVGTVETYWEWLSEDPHAVVRNLETHISSFSDRFRGKRTYDTVEVGQEQDSFLLRIQTSPGEWLKVYVKTNLRIRIEVTHQLRGKDRFQFPRANTSSGQQSRAGGHVSSDRQGVLALLERLRTRSASIVNAFLRHVRKRAEIIPVHVSSYGAILHILEAIPKNYPHTLPLLTMLIESGSIASFRSAPASYRAIIQSLCDRGILEKVPNRKAYAVTNAYRYPLDMLKKHASFPIITTRLRRRRRSE